LRFPGSFFLIELTVTIDFKDTALLAPALNGTWDWDDDFTLVTIPEANHFVQQDASAKVSAAILRWLGPAK
jgi:pimeloyl-ACP methyl ester carboxylesterase